LAITVLATAGGGGTAGIGGTGGGGGGGGGTTKKTFSFPHMLETSGRMQAMAAGDLDGDGCLDVVTTGSPGCIVSLQDATRRGTFSVCYSLSSVECGGLALDDFNRDGLLDVCCVEVATGALIVATGDPDFDLLRVLSLNGLPPGVPFEGMLLSSGDLDGDGLCDVLTYCPTAPGAPDSRLMAFGDPP